MTLEEKRRANPNYPFKAPPPEAKAAPTDEEIRALRDERFRAMGIPLGPKPRKRPNQERNRFVPSNKRGEPRMGLALTRDETLAVLAVLTVRNPLYYDAHHEEMIAVLAEEMHTMAKRRGWLTELYTCLTELTESK